MKTQWKLTVLMWIRKHLDFNKLEILFEDVPEKDKLFNVHLTMQMHCIELYKVYKNYLKRLPVIYLPETVLVLIIIVLIITVISYDHIHINYKHNLRSKSDFAIPQTKALTHLNTDTYICWLYKNVTMDL